MHDTKGNITNCVQKKLTNQALSLKGQIKTLNDIIDKAIEKNL
jgi:hypothetical protein